MAFICLSHLVTLALLPTVLAAVPYSQYILAPPSRTLTPIFVHAANGSVINPSALTEGSSGTTTLFGTSAITYDFGKNIGGLVSLTVNSLTGSANFVGASFTESSLWISLDGSDATQNVGIDETLWTPVNRTGNFTIGNSHQRGGFRYLNIYHNSSGSVELSSVTANFTAMPHYEDDALRDYTGHFHSDNERLNRVWYAGAYTNQLCTIPSTSGNSLVDPTANESIGTTYWWANSTLTNGSSALVDGAKRDKLIWPGDFSISLPVVFLSTNDQETLKLSVATLFAQQNESGMLHYVAAPLIESPRSAITDQLVEIYSFTYHLYNLLALNTYYVYSGDLPFLQDNWGRFVYGLNYSLKDIDSTGLAFVADNATADWLRIGMGAHNIEANSVLAYTLLAAQDLAYAVNDTALVPTWQRYYSNIVRAANDLLWDDIAGLYKDNQTTALHPQDGNAWAVLSGVANSSRAATISESLKSRWGPYGAPAPEAYGTTISPFISAFELQAHFLAGNPEYAIDLMEFMWGDFMLDDPRMTNSTFLEGYDVSGALHYPAYTDDSRISHAHGWSTGPVLALTNYVAGLHVVNPSTWRVQPQPGSLSQVEAGFTTAIGTFTASYSNNGTVSYEFQTPPGTTGMVIMTGVNGGIRGTDGTVLPLVDGVVESVPGGNWSLVLSAGSNGSGLGDGSYTDGSPNATSTYAGGASGLVISLLAIAGACLAVFL